MTFYLIGTGLDKSSISADALKILKTCDKIYLENYTVNFPYDIKELERSYNEILITVKQDFTSSSGGQEARETPSDREKRVTQTSTKLKITELSRSKVEDESILKEAKNSNIALLVYGDSLSATTHMQLILECKKQSIPYKIFHNASILIAIAETGLQLYKFGKTASMPNWAEHKNKPTSFMNYIKENNSIKAHTLLLTDIGLNIKDAIDQLTEAEKKINEEIASSKTSSGGREKRGTDELAKEGSPDFKLPEKIIAISNAGTSDQKIFYDTLEKLQGKKVAMPFCLIIPSELHFIESETLEELKE